MKVQRVRQVDIQVNPVFDFSGKKAESYFIFLIFIFVGGPSVKHDGISMTMIKIFQHTSFYKL